MAISFLSDKLNSMKTQNPSDHNGHKDPDAFTISAVLPTRIYLPSYISLYNCVTNVWNKTFYNKGLAWDFKWHISIFARNTFIGFKLIGKEKLRLTSSHEIHQFKEFELLNKFYSKTPIWFFKNVGNTWLLWISQWA